MKWRNIAYLAIIIFTIASCQAPTTGTEMYDGDPKTQDPIPEDMQEKIDAMKQEKQK